MDLFNENRQFLVIVDREGDTYKIRDISEVRDEQLGCTTDGQSYTWTSDPDYAKEVGKMLKSRGLRNWNPPYLASDMRFAVVSGLWLNLLVRLTQGLSTDVTIEDLYYDYGFESYRDWLYAYYPEWFDNDRTKPIPAEMMP